MTKVQAKTTLTNDIDFDSANDSEKSNAPSEYFTSYEKSKYDLAESGTNILISKPQEGELEKSLSDFAPGLGKEHLRIPATQIKEINRAVTRRLPQEDIDALMEERETLVKKKLAGDILKKEERRLVFVRWQLDRVEDAILGPRLDTLERMTEVYEGFASEIKNVLSQIKPEVEKKKPRKR